MSHFDFSRARRRAGASLRSRALTFVVAALLIGGTTGGAIAAGGAGGASNAASAQYKLGNGCGHSDVHTKSGKPCPPH